MSINRKLGDLANVLDDGTEGQVLSFNASGVIAASDIAAGASVYDSAALLPLSGLSAGDMAYVTGTNRFYISNGTGWYSVSLINTNPSITSVQDSAGGTTPFTLTTDGTATVITVTASDPEDVPLTYNYSVTSGSLTNGGGTTATVTQADNVFTVTPSTTEAYAGTFELTFTASDGINQGTSANSFTLSFITIITNSNYTTLLATATGTSDNNNITDASTNNHSITVTGDAYAGTFSPYRSGGYSTYFDGTGDYLQLSSVLPSGAFTVSCWAYFNTSNADAVWSQGTSGNAGRVSVQMLGSSLFFGIGSINVQSSAGSIVPKTWYYIEAEYSGSQIELFINGSSVGTASNTTNPQSTNFHVGTLGSSWDSTYELDGYVSDLKVVSGTPSGSSTVPTEPLSSSGSVLHICHLPYIADGSTNSHSITVNGNVSTKPFSPYDYVEYSATDHGGSVFLGGTAHDSEDRLEITRDTSLTMGSGDFTYEAWVYLYSEDVANEASLFSARASGYESFILKVRNSGTEGTNLLVSNSTGTSWSVLNTKGGAVFANVWTHVAIVRNGTSIKVYTNGKEAQSHTFSGSLNEDNNTLYIGYDADSRYGLGHVSDVRITKGTAVYTTEFTPPAAPLSSSGASLHIKGTDASIIDKSQVNNLKLIGGPTGSTTQAKFANTKSIDFGLTSDTYVMEVLSGAGYTGEFTIEFWMYNTDITSTWQTLITNSYVSGSEYFRLYKQTGIGQFSLYHNSVSGRLASIGNIVNNTWTHVAIVRDSSNDITVYQDGTSIGSYNNSTVFGTASSPINIGKGGVGDSTNYPMSGYIQDLRITKGLARYTANFTPPTASLEG